MLKNRLIPVLLLKDGSLVRSQEFNFHQVIGNPIHEVARFNEWNVDELIYLDISFGKAFDVGRPDTRVPSFRDNLDILKRVSKKCFMPLTWGGGIRDIHHASLIFKNGADKVVINSQAFRAPSLIEEFANRFGSQAVVVGIDFKGDGGEYEVCVDGGRKSTGTCPIDWAKDAEARGAGEILLQSINRDGTGVGYDLKLIEAVAKHLTVPVIALGGVGTFEHYAKAVEVGASAVAAANIWHFKEMADRSGKRALAKAGINVRL